MTDVLEQEIVQAPDLVSVEDYEQAVRLLVDAGNGLAWTPVGGIGGNKPGLIGQRWLNRAAEHLAQKLDHSFRDGPKVTTEQQAMVFVKGLAPHFLDASKALLKAAETLKAAGKGLAANEAYLAHKRADAKAQELNP